MSHSVVKDDMSKNDIKLKVDYDIYHEKFPILFSLFSFGLVVVPMV